MGIIGLRERCVVKIILIILISFNNLLWVFLSTIQMIFLVKGCKGDRTPMYRAFAPFFMGVRGDRRVTGIKKRIIVMTIIWATIVALWVKNNVIKL